MRPLAALLCAVVASAEHDAAWRAAAAGAGGGHAATNNPIYERAARLLRPLPPLPKPHLSWPIYFGPSAANPQGPTPELEALLTEFARVTRALPLSLGTSEEEVAKAVEIARAAGANITLNYSPWLNFLNKHLPPTHVGPEEGEELSSVRTMLLNVSRWLGHAGGEGMATALLLDSETFFTHASDPPVQRAAVDRKHDLIFNLTRSVFPTIRIEQFGRGGCRHNENDQGRGSGGWGTSAYYSLRERGQMLGVLLYTVPELGYLRQAYNRTVHAAAAAGEPCEGASVCPVTPWISLGAGFRRGFLHDDPGTNTSSFPAPYAWTWSWDYEHIYSWQLGAEINRPWFAERSGLYADWGRAKAVSLFPSPFDDRSMQLRGDDGNQSTVMFEHFVAYVRGAAGIENTADLLGAANSRPAGVPSGLAGSNNEQGRTRGQGVTRGTERQVVKVSVGAEVVARAEPELLSYTIDSASFCGDGLQEYLENAEVRARVRALAPMVLRLGGTSEDMSQYAGGPRLPTLPGVPPRCNQSAAALAAVSRFANATGVKVMFGLNALLREGASQSGGWASGNAAALLAADAARARAERLRPMFGYELGNEPHLWQYAGYGKNISAAAHAADWRQLRALVSQEYKGLSPAPRLVGPDVWVPCLVHGEPGGPATAGSTPACDVAYLSDFFAAQPDLDVVTFHL